MRSNSFILFLILSATNRMVFAATIHVPSDQLMNNRKNLVLKQRVYIKTARFSGVSLNKRGHLYPRYFSKAASSEEENDERDNSNVLSVTLNGYS